jgi:hypothetical protein
MVHWSWTTFGGFLFHRSALLRYIAAGFTSGLPACSAACANKVPRIIGTVRIVEHHACAGFYGYTDRKPTAEELRSVVKAQKLKELGVESNKRGDL